MSEAHAIAIAQTKIEAPSATAIQKAIDDCAVKGGGRVLVPGGGTYVDNADASQGAHLHFSSAYILKQLKQLFFSPRNYAAFLNRRAVARRKGKLFSDSCFHSMEDAAMNYTDTPVTGN